MGLASFRINAVVVELVFFVDRELIRLIPQVEFIILHKIVRDNSFRLNRAEHNESVLDVGNEAGKIKEMQSCAKEMNFRSKLSPLELDRLLDKFCIEKLAFATLR